MRGWRVIRLPRVRSRVSHLLAPLRPVWVRDEPRVALPAEVESPLGPLVQIDHPLTDGSARASNGRALARPCRTTARS
ncbi:MAG: hypothetical protein JWR64_992, partial [Marmoricola sp.]|nr:hypothetical protein [Marmoricola sp.]